MSAADRAIKAAKAGHNRVLLKMLESTPALASVRSHDGNTLLITAVMNERINVFDAIKNNKIVQNSINDRNHNGMTALMWALEVDNTYMTVELLRLGANKKMLHPQTRMTLFKTAVNKKLVTQAHFLNARKIVVQQRVRLAKQGILNTSLQECVDTMLQLHNDFLNGNWHCIALSSLVFSHAIVSTIQDTDVYARVGMANEHIDGLRRFKRLELRKMMKEYTPKIKSATSQETIDVFKKDIQWPHLPFVFVAKARGSCLDLLLLKVMLYEKEKQDYNFGLYTGSNTLLSHAEAFSHTGTKTSNKTLVFAIFSMYHIFRAVQVCRYSLKDEHKEQQILACAFAVLHKLVPNSFVQLRVFKFLITRTAPSYDSCIKLYKQKSLQLPRGRFFKSVPKSIHSKVAKRLQDGFPESLGVKSRKEVIDFVFNRKHIRNVLYTSTAGICVFRNIEAYDKRRLHDKYSLETAVTGTYIAFIVKTNKKFAGFASHVFEQIFEYQKPNHIVLEVNKNNTKALSVYQNMGFKKIGTSHTQLLLTVTLKTLRS